MRVLPAGLGLALLAATAVAQPDPIAPLDRLFSADQAARGGQVFAGQCAACHTPAQAASLFVERSAGQTLADYHRKLSALMPPETDARPSPAQFVDIIAYLAGQAGAEPGPRAAALDDPAWRGVRLAAGARPRAVKVRLDAPNADWPYWRGTQEGLGYSPIAQIDRTNVSRLKIAWSWSAANFGPTPDTRNIATPIMVGGVLYVTAGPRRDVVAIDAATGETLWLWRPQETEARFDNAPRKGSGRGVAYWSGAKAAPRIFTITPGFHLAALDARTGRPIEGFANHGVLDLMPGLRDTPKTGLPEIGNSSPPLVIGDVVVVGPALLVGLRPKSSHNVKGDVRGFDARTGKLV
ncbi:MAG TPA: c-type cytochrome, partial [Caulobacteraceae bacterium]|nr:c-type cytochrome [Caulobacteraceae bacterium]